MNAVIILGSIVLFLKSICGNQIAFMLDIFHQQYPWQEIDNTVLALVGRSFPSWNPFMNLGCPLLADPQMQIYYPPALVYRLFPFPTAHGLYLCMHLVIAGMGMASFLRRQGLSSMSALLGAMGFAYGAHPALLVFNAPILAGYCWLPWVAGAAWEAGRSRSWPSIMWLGLCFTWLVLSGYPQYPIYGILLAIVCDGLGGRTLRSVIPFVLATIVCCFLAAEIVWPAVKYIVSETDRGVGIDHKLIQLDAMPFSRLLGYLVPLGQLSSEMGSPQNVRPMWVTLHFVGTPAILLSIAWVTFGLRDMRMFQALTLVTIGFGMGLVNGMRGASDLLSQVPVINMMKHSGMWLALSDFGILWLAALSMEELANSQTHGFCRQVSSMGRQGGLSLLALGGVCFWLHQASVAHGWYAIWNITNGLRWLIHPGLLMWFISEMLALREKIAIGRALAAILVLGYGELLIVDHVLQPVGSAKCLMDETPTEQWLKETMKRRGGWLRVISWPMTNGLDSLSSRSASGETECSALSHFRETLSPNLPAAVGLRQADGETPLVPARVRSFMANPVFASPVLTRIGKALLLDVGVSHLIGTTPIGGEAREVFKNYSTVYQIGSPRTPVSLDPMNAGQARIVESRPGSWSIEATIVSPCTVVVNEAYMRGWTAFDGNTELQPHAYHDVLIGVRLGKGIHHLKVAYSPMEVPASLLLSICSLLALVVYMLSQMRMRPDENTDSNEGAGSGDTLTPVKFIENTLAPTRNPSKSKELDTGSFS